MTRTVTRAMDPRTAEPIGPEFPDDDLETVRAITGRAETLIDHLGALTDQDRGSILRAVARGIRQSQQELITITDAETGLGSDRLAGEVERTAGQIEAFATLVTDGRHHEAIIDLPREDRPDIRRLLIGVGPVAVFGASNFPLAFGVLGGDTASALAAGCPVVAKAHPSHPATSALCAEISRRALDRIGAPPDLVQLVHGAHPDIGAALVQSPEVQAVGFTGSLTGGRALYDLAAARPQPIPVYAEMGSLNPAFVLPEAARPGRQEQVAHELAAAVGQGSGQFCTKPGLVVLPLGEHGDAMTQQLIDGTDEQVLGPLLNRAVQRNFLDRVRALADTPVRLSASPDEHTLEGYQVRPAVAVTDAQTFMRDSRLHDEIFGPATIIVRADPEEYARLAAGLRGCLAASVYGEPTADAADLVRGLAQRCGRIVWNAPTTGLAVTTAQNHTGPYPATTAPGHTSVGMTAIRRFQRPVAYQAAPQPLLPPPLQDDNPWDVPRMIDGEWQHGAVTTRSA